MSSPTDPRDRVLLGTEIRIWAIAYSEFAAAVGQPKITFTTGDVTPDATTYPSATEVAKLLTENYESEFGGETIKKLTHSRGPLKFAGKEMAKMTMRTLDVLDPNFLDFFPGLTVTEDASGIEIKPSRKVGNTSNILLAVWPQSTELYYEIIFKPSGEGKWKTSAAADGNSVQMLELIVDGEFVTDRVRGDQVGYIYRPW